MLLICSLLFVSNVIIPNNDVNHLAWWTNFGITPGWLTKGKGGERMLPPGDRCLDVASSCQLFFLCDFVARFTAGDCEVGDAAVAWVGGRGQWLTLEVEAWLVSLGWGFRCEEGQWQTRIVPSIGVFIIQILRGSPAMGKIKSRKLSIILSLRVNRTRHNAARRDT